MKLSNKQEAMSLLFQFAWSNFTPKTFCALSLNMVLLLSLSLNTSFAQQGFVTDIDADSISMCIDEHDFAERRKAKIEHRLKNIKKFTLSSIKKGYSLIDVSGYSTPLLGHSVLTVDLSLLKTKAYLKPERLLLIGSGFNDLELIETATQLELLGFRDVKVLLNGRRADELSDANQQKDLKLDTTEYLISAEKVLAASSLSIDDGVVFVADGNNAKLFEGMNVRFVPLPSEIGTDTVKYLSQVVAGNGLKNSVSDHTKFVFVAEGDVDRAARQFDGFAQSHQNFWYLDGGLDAIVAAISRSKIAPVRARSHLPNCIKNVAG